VVDGVSSATKAARDAWFKKIGYKPHPPQLLYHDALERFRIPCCGRRFGKSTMAARDMEPKLFQPNKRFWIVGPTYDLGEKEFRVIWNDLIVGQKFGRDKRVKKSYNKRSGDMFIEFPWQTRLEVRSADHPDNLVGEALDWVIMSEAAKQKKETWERMIRPALADKRGGADFPTTPEGFNWLYDLWMLGQNPDEKLYNSWTFASWANTAVYPDGRQDAEILDLERNTVEEWFMQEIGAEFSAFVGKIYGEFREAIHVKQTPYRPDLANYIAFDWGWANPMAAVEFQIDHDDTVRVWRVHYKKGMTVRDYVEMMKKAPQPPGYRIACCFGDHARPDAAVEVTQLLAPCITDPEAKADWNRGVDLFKKFLKVHDIEEMDPDTGAMHHIRHETHFQVDFSCTDFIKEINNYKSKAPVKGNNVPEMGQNQADHCMDAIRYGLMHVFVLGTQHHLSEVADINSWQQHDSGLLVPQQSAHALSGTDAFTDDYGDPGSGLWTPESDAGTFTMAGRF
jgi:hypothetical protein